MEIYCRLEIIIFRKRSRHEVQVPLGRHVKIKATEASRLRKSGHIMTRELGYISSFSRYAHASSITIFGSVRIIQSTWGQTLTCADGESIYSSIFSVHNISVCDTTTVPWLRRADQESRAVDLRVLLEEKFRSSGLIKLSKLRIADRQRRYFF